jgi:hypothetical protein
MGTYFVILLKHFQINLTSSENVLLLVQHHIKREKIMPLLRMPRKGDIVENNASGERWEVNHTRGGITYECEKEIDSKKCFIGEFRKYNPETKKFVVDCYNKNFSIVE